MISAREAREKATSIDLEACQKQLREIETKITAAILEGKTDCYIYIRPMPAVKQQLEQLGYIVRSNDDGRNGTDTRIYWSQA